MADQDRVQVELSREEVAEVRRLASEHGVDVEVPGPDPVESLAGAALLLIGATASVGTVLYMLERHRGGQIIDLRGDSPELRRSKDLVFGLVVIFLRDGTVKVEVHEPRGLAGQSIDALKGIVVDLAKQPLESARAMVAATLEGRAKVSAQAAGAPGYSEDPT